MMSMMLLILLITCVALILIMLVLILMETSLKDRETLSPFECGFDSPSKARLPFSLRFYLLGILFIIFDVEIALMIPLPLLIQKKEMCLYLMISLTFLLLLLGGLLHEWNEGSLQWIE